ncbi:MAG: hypothetical protein FWB96_03425 [Defluviitaleaceae bacterium]|nr:hypothetical protein [Defluviitaleaceae bacterium]MCL2261730.1 hypothetical protein [Defluviitaleaceae bacterium]
MINCNYTGGDQFAGRLHPPISKTHLNAATLEKAAKFKELTGREIVVEKDSYGNLITITNPNSTQRFGFFVDFFRVGLNSGTECFNTNIENISRRYAELRDELLARYGDNEDELYAQMGELNQAFETALHNTLLLLAPMSQEDLTVSINSSASAEEAEEESVTEILHQSKTRSMNLFFETFIKSIQHEDFETAFSNAINAKEGERND